ncbi:hypothetical protein [Rhizobium sp. SEMIA 4085]|nr:hypothetical protein [Rhizobium sp. SEMIA 4085]
MAEDPTFQLTNNLVIRDAVITVAIYHIEHTEQADRCVETILAGFV